MFFHNELFCLDMYTFSIFDVFFEKNIFNVQYLTNSIAVRVVSMDELKEQAFNNTYRNLVNYYAHKHMHKIIMMKLSNHLTVNYDVNLYKYVNGTDDLRHAVSFKITDEFVNTYGRISVQLDTTNIDVTEEVLEYKTFWNHYNIFFVLSFSIWNSIGVVGGVISYLKIALLWVTILFLADRVSGEEDQSYFTRISRYTRHSISLSKDYRHKLRLFAQVESFSQERRSTKMQQPPIKGVRYSIVPFTMLSLLWNICKSRPVADTRRLPEDMIEMKSLDGGSIPKIPHSDPNFRSVS